LSHKNSECFNKDGMIFLCSLHLCRPAKVQFVEESVETKLPNKKVAKQKKSCQTSWRQPSSAMTLAALASAAKPRRNPNRPRQKTIDAFLMSVRFFSHISRRRNVCPPPPKRPKHHILDTIYGTSSIKPNT
jgi:hypothetical protein